MIEIAQNLLVKLDPVLNQRIAAEELTQDTSLFGCQNTAQAAVAELTVADKAQTFDFRQRAFENFKHQINAVVRPANDPWSHSGRNPTLRSIGLGDCNGVALCSGWVEHAAGLGRDRLGERIVLKAPVALKTDDVDGWVFDYGNDQRITARRELDAFKQAGRKDVLIGFVQIAPRQHLTRSDSRVTDDGAVIDTVVSFDGNGIQIKALCV